MIYNLQTPSEYYVSSCAAWDTDAVSRLKKQKHIH